MFAPRFQPHGTPLICCTDLLPHTPTPTNTPPGDGTSLNWMPLRAASACRPARDATQCSAVRRPHKTALKVHPMFTQSNQCKQSSIKHAQKRTQALPQASLPPPTMLARPFPHSDRLCPLQRRCACAPLLPVLPHTPWPLERPDPWNAFALGSPWHTIPYHAIPYHTTPHHTIPCHTTPHHTIPHHPSQSLCMCLLVACLATHALALGTPLHWARLGTPYHTIPYHTIPHHTIPYHTIPHHTIPFQSLSIPIPFHHTPS